MYHTHILLAGATFDKLPQGEFMLRLVDRVTVKGKGWAGPPLAVAAKNVEVYHRHWWLVDCLFTSLLNILPCLFLLLTFPLS